MPPILVLIASYLLRPAFVEREARTRGAPLVIKWGKHGSFYACSTYDKEDPNTCTFTKENPINLPDLDSADVQETTQEEYCENCGRVMVLKRGRFGQFMACTGYPDPARPRAVWTRAKRFLTFRSTSFAPSAGAT